LGRFGGIFYFMMGQNDHLLLHHKIENIIKPPECLGMCIILLVRGWCTLLNFWAEKLFWLPFDRAKIVHGQGERFS